MGTAASGIVAILAFSGSLIADVAPEDVVHREKRALSASHIMLPLQDLPPEGGLVGAADLSGVRGAVTDRSHIMQVIRDYSRQHGPFSSPGVRGDYPRFPIFPAGGREWEDLMVVNYVDLDTLEGPYQDWDCRGYTYDGYVGHDALLGNFDHQLIGVPVIAVLDGTVVDLRDGEPDQNTEHEDRPGNFIGIHHGGERYCWYDCLKQGSISVEVGQEVRAGEQIAQVGASGGADWPLMAFSVWVPTGNEDEWTHDEPYAGQCNLGLSGWKNQVGIPEGTTCRDFGVTTTDLNEFFADGILQWRPPMSGSITLDHDRLWMWTTAIDVGIFSTYQMRFYDPSGNLNYNSGTQFLNNSATSYKHYVTWFAWDLDGLHTIPGTWTVDVIVNGEPYINFPVEVLESGETLANRPPEPIVASLGPAVPTPDDLLTCRVFTEDIPDLDWDLVRFRYTWSVGGRVLRDVTSAGLADHLPRLEGCGGAVVECTVVPSDGTDDGQPYTIAVRLDGSGVIGDTNCDGSVNIFDLLIVLSDYGPCAVCAGDIDGDEKVDIFDLLNVIANWGS